MVNNGLLHTPAARMSKRAAPLGRTVCSVRRGRWASCHALLITDVHASKFPRTQDTTGKADSSQEVPTCQVFAIACQCQTLATMVGLVVWRGYLMFLLSKYAFHGQCQPNCLRYVSQCVLPIISLTSHRHLTSTLVSESQYYYYQRYAWETWGSECSDRTLRTTVTAMTTPCPFPPRPVDRIVTYL